MDTIKTLTAFLLSAFIFLFPTDIFSAQKPKTETAVFAGGCFWTMQFDFDQVPGVVNTTVGYSGGTTPHPTYEQVESGDSGHYESIEVVYNPAKVTYQQLLEIYWHNIDPTNANGQFCDSGNQYRPVIFYSSPEQKKLASESKQQLIKSGRFTKVVTQILPMKAFYPAEAYHQKFYRNHASRYDLYRKGCGRDYQLQKLWGTQ
ncbi:Peptide methionine sulfoxide reductase MsrA [Aquicella siphonis]|uniref:Peptide methionine sulfoxide reductase MsrA n=1 Tax=Aquicella siphonis TaxID=254247 RepID=A0A5E4PHX8_9COXI|nr:peptide-methionine (S)-S-oxide reductase MsrA [Aquicella siphonis]VVC76619.1 Peptide methionine sulfoxide reductase MsrA [Aquicella siphonis]